MTWITTGAWARLLERSTDLSIEVHAGTLPQLFDMAALALMALQYLPLPFEAAETGRAPLRAELEGLGERAPPRTLDLAGHDSGALLVHWLRELNYVLESERFVYTGAVFRELGPTLEAVTSGVRARTPPLREVKGVTYHELVVSPVGEEWIARISCDL